VPRPPHAAKGKQYLERELVVDTYRLAVLPIVYLAEQQDPFGLSRQEAALDEGYRDVFQAGAWLYALHSYCLLVRGYLGGKTADAVREHQELLLSGGFSDKKDEISGAIELISQASAGQSDSMPETAVSAAISVEWNVALNLLRGLPDSPDFQSQSAEAVTIRPLSSAFSTTDCEHISEHSGIGWLDASVTGVPVLAQVVRRQSTCCPTGFPELH
jgi:hypothetical protein